MTGESLPSPGQLPGHLPEQLLSPSPKRRGVVAVVQRREQFLVIQRSQTVAAPGMFCFPGGGIEADETESVAVVREMYEELGVACEPQRLLWRSETPWQVALAWWHVVLAADARLVPNPAEVESAHWLTMAEMRRLAKLLPSNRAFLDAYERGELMNADSGCEPRYLGCAGEGPK